VCVNNFVFVPPAICGGPLTGWYAGRVSLVGLGDGAPINSWVDSSGYAGHGNRTLIQGTKNPGPGSQPGPVAKTFTRGLPSARFDVIADPYDTLLTSDPIPPQALITNPLANSYLLTNGWSMFVVCRPTFVNGDFAALSPNAMIGDYPEQGFYFLGFALLAGQTLAGLNLRAGAGPRVRVSLGRPVILMARYDGAVARLASSDGFGDAVTIFDNLGGGGAAMGVGSFRSTISAHVNQYFGDVAEIITYGGFCSDPDAQNIMLSLRAVYGL